MGDIYHPSHDADFFRLNPIGSEFIYVGEPVISCLEAVTFFRVSKLTHRGPERQCNPARYPKPCKRQTAPAAGHGWQLPQWTTGSPDIYK